MSLLFPALIFKLRPATSQCLQSHPLRDLGRLEDGGGLWLLLMSWLWEGQACPHGTPEFTRSPGGVPPEGLVAIS